MFLLPPRLGDDVDGVLGADRRERFANSRDSNAPSKLAFAAYALVTTLITGAFFAFLARVIVRSSL